MPSSWKDQLLSLKDVTERTGTMHDAQVLQLKMWGGIAFGGLDWEAKVDPADKSVLYDIASKIPPRRVKDMANVVAALERSVHWLFGDHWLLKVRNNDNLLYEGKRVLPDVNEQRKSRRKDRKS